MNIAEYDNLSTLEKVKHFSRLPPSQRPSDSLVFGVGRYNCNKPRGIEFSVGDRRTVRYNPVFQFWRNMLQRCYSLECLSRYPSYEQVTVCEDWLEFSNFHNWWEGNYREGYQLDKDIISDGKVYSPNTCVYVPLWLNNFTVSRGRDRGEFLIGSCFDRKRGKFLAQCKDGSGKKVYLGHHETELEAHTAWKTYKLDLALERKHLMDSINPQIYSRIIEIIHNVR